MSLLQRMLLVMDDLFVNQNAKRCRTGRPTRDRDLPYTQPPVASISTWLSPLLLASTSSPWQWSITWCQRCALLLTP